MSNRQFVPRTLKQAFGPYAKLHNEKPKFPVQHYILPLVMGIVYAVWLYVMLVK